MALIELKPSDDSSVQKHALLENQDCGMSSFPCFVVFDIWECEMITENPRNSVYIMCI